MQFFGVLYPPTWRTLEVSESCRSCQPSSPAAFPYPTLIKQRNEHRNFHPRGTTPTGYETGKRLMPQQWGTGADMATGAFAQVLAGVVYTPIDIVKERLQVQAMMPQHYSHSRYGSPLEAFRSLLQQGQGVRGVFKGYWATNAVWLPWNSLYIAGYEQLKRTCAAAMSGAEQQQGGSGQQQQQGWGQQQQQQLPAWVIAGCSATAAAAAAVVTHPFDVVKTRLQVLSAQPQHAGLTALQVAQQQLQREGASSFFHGLTARLLNIAPGCALSWALYEQLKLWLDEE